MGPWRSVRLSVESLNGRLLLIVCQLKVSNHSVCQQHTYFYTSQGQHIFSVSHNEVDVQNLCHLILLGVTRVQ